jgi:toxin ParE1/3/4
MRKLIWAQCALFDRDAIFDHIEAENPTAAIHVDEQIGLAVRRLVDFPRAEDLAKSQALGNLSLRERLISRPVRQLHFCQKIVLLAQRHTPARQAERRLQWRQGGT